MCPDSISFIFYVLFSEFLTSVSSMYVFMCFVYMESFRYLFFETSLALEIVFMSRYTYLYIWISYSAILWLCESLSPPHPNLWFLESPDWLFFPSQNTSMPYFACQSAMETGANFEKSCTNWNLSMKSTHLHFHVFWWCCYKSSDFHLFFLGFASLGSAWSNNHIPLIPSFILKFWI